MTDEKVTHILCIYSTELLGANLFIEQPTRTMQAAGDGMEGISVNVKQGTPYMNGFFRVKTLVQAKTIIMWFWLLIGGSHRLFLLRDFELPVFEGVVYLVTEPQGVPGSLPVLLNSYLQQFEDEFKKAIEFLSIYYRIIPKTLVIQLHYSDKATPLNTLLDDAIYEEVAPHIIHRVCSINELDKIRDIIVDYVLHPTDT